MFNGQSTHGAAVVDAPAPGAGLVPGASLDELLEVVEDALRARADDAQRIADVLDQAFRLVGHGEAHAGELRLDGLDAQRAGVRRAGDAFP